MAITSCTCRLDIELIPRKITSMKLTLSSDIGHFEKNTESWIKPSGWRGMLLLGHVLQLEWNSNTTPGLFCVDPVCRDCASYILYMYSPFQKNGDISPYMYVRHIYGVAGMSFLHCSIWTMNASCKAKMASGTYCENTEVYPAFQEWGLGPLKVGLRGK